MKKVKLIVTLVIIVVVLALAAFAAYKFGLFDAKKDELSIDKTANVITEIKKISEFTTACYYEEIVLREEKESDNIANSAMKLLGRKSISKDELVIIANGNVRAGFKLDRLSDDNIMAKGDTLNVKLPKAEILDVLVNPSDFSIYVEDGTWDTQTVTKIKSKAADKIKKDALENAVLEKAQESGMKKLVELFKSFGFTEVTISVKE